MKKLAWGVVAVDILVALGLAVALGLLASVFLGSGNAPDRNIGLGTICAALAALAHPGPAILLAMKEKFTGAAIFSGVCALFGGGLLVIAVLFLQATVSP